MSEATQKGNTSSRKLDELSSIIKAQQEILDSLVEERRAQKSHTEYIVSWTAHLFDLSNAQERLWEKYLASESEEDSLELKREIKKIADAAYNAFETFPELLDLGSHFKHTVSFWELFDDFAEEFEDREVISDKEEMTKRRKAREMARKAVKAKHCLICGTSQGRNLHRHHYDYNEPIDVFVLCLKHHFKLHKQMREMGRWFTRQETVDYIKGQLEKVQLPSSESPVSLLLQ